MWEIVKSKTVVVALILVFVLEGMILPAVSPAFGRRHSPPPVMYQSGTVVANLPPGCQALRVKEKGYFYHGGTFYQRRHRGFIVARPPVGAVVGDLPAGFTMALIAGATYFLFAEAFYRQVPSGYMVVAPPVQAESSTPQGASVSVNAELLNVRSGPGMDYLVIAQVRKGTCMVVRGQAPQWLNVDLQNGVSGWIMTRFTVRLSPQPALG